MASHAPPNYVCPFCRLASGIGDDYSDPADIVHRDTDTFAFVSGKGWPNNPGHVVVVPQRHVENIYDIPADLLAATYQCAQQVALGMKRAYSCEGISMRQHNEPAGDQDVWHFHVHVFPRHTNDQLYLQHNAARRLSSAERAMFATRLRKQLTATTPDDQ